MCEVKLSIFEKNYDKAIELLKQAEVLSFKIETIIIILFITY